MNAVKCLAAGVTVAFLAAGLLAQERPRERRGPAALPPGFDRLDLNGEQKEKIAKLQKDTDDKVTAAQKKLEEALQDARQNQDRAKAGEANEAFRKTVAELQERFQEQLKQVLTEEQKRRLAELERSAAGGRPGPDLGRLIGQLDLGDEQRAKVEKLMKEFAAKRETAEKNLRDAVEQARQNQDRQKVQDLLQSHQQETAKAHEELLAKLQELLSDEQKRKLVELQRRTAGPPFGPFGPLGPGFGQLVPMPLQDRLGLTPEQKEKLAKLQHESEAKLREILTEEQNRRIEEIRKGGPPPRPRD